MNSVDVTEHQASGVVRNAVAHLTRQMPARFRGRGRVLNACEKWLTGPPIVEAPMKLGHRLVLDLRSRTEVGAYYTGRYDHELIVHALRLLPRGGCALDVGANIGFWAVPLARLATVHAFEPVSSNAKRLVRNARLNALQDLHVHEVALSDERREAVVTLREDFQRGGTTGNASMAIAGFDEDMPTEPVMTTTLDLWAAEQNLPHVDVAKIDIEGHEDAFLRGARSTIARHRPVMWMELNHEYYRRRRVEPADVVGRALVGLEYRYLRRDDHGRWVEVNTFDSPHPIDDLILAPAERVEDVTRTATQ